MMDSGLLPGTTNFSTVRLWKTVIRRIAIEGAFKRPLAVLGDASLLWACWHLGYLFRMGVDRWQPARPWYDDAVLAGVIAAHLLALGLLKLYRMPWRFFGFEDMVRIVGAVTLVGAVSGLVVVSTGLSGVARSVLLLHPVFAIVALCSVRMTLRVLWEHAQRRVERSSTGAKRAVVMGSAVQVEKALAQIQSGNGQWLVKAVFLSDAQRSRPSHLGGVPVAGSPEALASYPLMDSVDYVFVAEGSNKATNVDAALEHAKQAGKSIIPITGG